jgi:hypothetical protein
LTAERTNVCERKLVERVVLVETEFSKLRGKIDPLHLIDMYFAKAHEADFDFEELHKIVRKGSVRLTYYPRDNLGFAGLDRFPGFPRSSRTDLYANDPVPSFILSDNTLCLGALHHMHPYLFLQLGIKSFVSCGATEFSAKVQEALPEVEGLVLREFPDDGRTSAQKLFQPCVDFIRAQRAKGHLVLVHCHRGVSRSATMVMAFLIAEFGMSVQEAWRAVRRARPRAWPSARLEQDLMVWEYMCHGQRKTLAVVV